MPDRCYNTRLRTNSVLLPPRRLRHSPSPQPCLRPKHKPTVAHPNPAPPFPPPNVILHPDDANNKTLIAIGRALLAVDNRAITIKDLSHLTLDYGLVCHNVSAASQAITTFIRNHLNRCHHDHSKPLLLSLALTGTPDDDRLAPALHSRTGGTSSKDHHHCPAITSFRRGTTVWYLSERAGAPCPFKRAGLVLDDILASAHCPKRKRESRYPLLPRKMTSPGPAMATRNRTHHQPSQTAALLRVKLTLRPPEPQSQPLTESDSDSDSDSASCDSDSLSSVSASELSDGVSICPSSPPSAPCPLPPYPILSPSIPSPICTTPSTTLASPSVPCVSFLPVTTALSNPPRDMRSRSCSLPFSSASPPPDSEDEDEDFHNSMVGLRRGSVPLLKKEEVDHVPTDWGTPLEFLSFEPPLVKAEPINTLPLHSSWNDDGRWDAPEEQWDEVKREHPSDDERTVLDPDEVPALAGKGTREDPVHIDPVVRDVELLGPESVRSREWDAAWCNAAVKESEEDRMEVVVDPELEPESLRDPEACPGLEELRASPADTLDTIPTTISSPPADAGEIDAFDFERDMSFILHPLRPCEPPVIATIIDGIPVYHTLLAPGFPLLRRIDIPLVALSPLLTFLGLPPHTPFWAPLAVAQSLVAPHTHVLPPGVTDVFLHADLHIWFPDSLARLVPLPRETGIRAEDVVVRTVVEERERDAVDVVGTGTGAGPVVVGFDVLPEVGVPLPLDEQEENLFRSFVDFTEPVRASVADKENVKSVQVQVRRKRGEGQATPVPISTPAPAVRRSKRTAVKHAAIAAAARMTRSRSRK